MAITTTSSPVWHFRGDIPKQYLPDPRTAIVRQIQWVRPQYGKEGRGLTDWSTPEPDAFTHAFYSEKPIECPFCKNQVWYYDEQRSAWFSVYYLEPEQKLEWARWFLHQPYLAYWTVLKASQIRRTRPLLMEKKRQTKYDDPTLNERLHQQEYYSMFISKVEEDAKFSVLQRIGEA